MSLERPNATGLAATSYAQVVVTRGSRLVFVSGQASVDERGGVVAPGDFAGQVRQAHANLVAALAAAGATVGDVAKLTTFVVGYRPELLPEIRQPRADVVGPGVSPGSTLTGVDALTNP